MKSRVVKNFHIDGIALDQETILRLQGQLESRIVDDMRSKGYVPVLDITPEMFWEYQKESQDFKYLIVVYGTFVGKRKAKEIMGMLGPHPIYLEPNSKQYDSESE